MSRVYFNSSPTPGEWLNAQFAPRPVRGAIRIAQRISFSPDVKRAVKAQAIRRLRDEVDYYASMKDEFQSSEALAVLAFMDTFRDILRETKQTMREVQKSDPQSVGILRRKVKYYDSKLAVCALYMRRSGFMDQDMLGEELYKAAEAMETVYIDTERSVPVSIQPVPQVLRYANKN